MKKIFTGIIGAVMVSSLSAFAEFTPPTEEQLAAAANDPAMEAALLQGASAEQAAQVMKAIIVQVLASGLDSQAVNARVASIVSAGFAAMPAGSAPALASSLGSACGATLAISANPAVVSSIQSTIATAGGSGGADLAASFGESYTEAKADSTTAAKDAEPPKAKGYAVQH